MKLTDLLTEVAALVEEREIIDHGFIRCLSSQEAMDSICSAEGCDEVDTGSVGDDDLAEKLREITEQPECLLDADADDLADALKNLYRDHCGDRIEHYVDSEKEDELRKLDRLIASAEKLIATL